jgi:phosphatidate cytidylyltransferase
VRDLSLLKQRLVTSAVLITVVLALVYLDANHCRTGCEGLWLLPLLLFFALGTTWDIAAMMRRSGQRISTRVAGLATTIVALGGAVPLCWPLSGRAYPADCSVGRVGWIVAGGVLAIFVVLLVEMIAFEKTSSVPGGEGARRADADHGPVTSRVGLTVFASLYVALPMALLVPMRALGSGGEGLAALLTTIAVTKSADAGAYFTGKAFGRHKLVPRLSPGKTWEGLGGGLITATIVAWVCLSGLFPATGGSDQMSTSLSASAFLSRPIGGSILLGPLLALSGLGGDLGESLIKRDLGSKDSGNSLPGLGGFWDVTDSLVASVLPAYLFFSAWIDAAAG